MKKVNLWKTLFFSVLTVAAFTGCSDDDSDDGGGIPSITVNGGSKTATVAVALEGGETEAVTIESSGDWAVTFSGDDVADCEAVPATGGRGTTSLKFELGSRAAERTITATVTTSGSFEGIPLQDKVTITIMQNAGGSTEVQTNVKEIRNTLTFPSTATEITEDLTLTGIVVSDYEGNNINAKQAMLVDNTTEPGAGITVRFENAYTDDLKMTKGSIVSIKIKGGKSQSYSGLYQVQIESKSPEVTIVDANDNTPEAIEVTDLSKLAEYQSQLVKIYAQPVEDIRGAYYYDASLANNGGYVTRDFQTKTGATVELSFNKYTGTVSGENPWADKLQIPSNAGYVKGCVSVYSGGSQLTPRNADDLAGLTEPLFTIEAPEVTIDKLGEGNYKVKDATIVGVHQKGVMFAQKVSGTVYYVLGFNNSWTTQTSNPYIESVGKLADVQGACEDRFGLYQFSTFEATAGNDSSLQLPTPETFDAVAIDAYTKAPAYKYVKLSGVLHIENGSSYKTYTISVAGVSGKTITFAYGLDAKFSGLADGDVIDATGFALGYDSSQSKLNIMLETATKNTSTPAVTITTTPSTFAADGGTQDIAFAVANPGSNKVYAKVEGEGFSVPTGDVTSPVKVTAEANTGAAREAKLTIYAAASEGGEAVAQATVTLRQSGVSSGAGYTLIDNVADLTAGTYYMAGFSEEYQDTNFAPYSYHVWAGTVSSGDLVTVGYEFADGNLTINPSAKGEAALITLEAVSGSTNTYYIKSGDKYLKGVKGDKRSMGLVDTSDGAEWTFEAHDKGGIKISNPYGSNTYILGTAGASSNLLRSYKDPASSLVYGVCFFKAN